MQDTEPTDPALKPNKDVLQWAMICHFAAALGFFFPFGNLIGPLIVWQIKKDQHAFINEQGKEALNFQLTVSIASIVCIALMLVIIGFFLLGLLGLVNVVLVIIAGIKAGEGQAYRYPFCLRLLK
jgi:uncharacterized Tic20 family protein